MTVPPSSGPEASSSKPTRARWVIGLFLCLGTAISYVDRANLSVGLPFMEADLDINKAMTGVLLAAFFWTYAPGQLLGGRLVDLVGPRIAAGFATLWWSFFTAINAVAGGLATLLIFRLGLGIGESVAPSAFGKVVGRWFPLRERARAAALYDSGSRLGTALAFPIVSLIIYAFGWRASFVVAGGLGVLWVIGWFGYYRDPEKHRFANDAEKRLIREGGARIRADHDDTPQPTVRWRDLLRFRTVWGMMLGFFALNFAFYFFVTWFPSYLVEARGMDLLKIAWVGVIPPLVAFFCEFGGGALSDRLTRRYGPTKGRKIPIVSAMVLASSIALAAIVPSAAVAVGLLSLSMGCLAVAAASIWSLPADVAPSEGTVGSVGGLQNFASNVAGIICPIFFGLFAGTGSSAFVLPLVVTGGIVIVGAACYLLICRTFEPLQLPQTRTTQPEGAVR
ncbi:MFS transporter [Microlunatus soli]|uniref:MFS transporter, ACS family, glucarate transporter n=1 Tax=Microlunatus soli TaxID=630515 RepID=A0A1H2ANX4_9ACTN|nr:MFS transporter [Microlunatus soli]SDT47584.1 MFS transporter, ACS family, glucarate transporter [Microlunatus soli]